MIEFAKSRPIVIVQYQPRWADEFLQIGGELRQVLGATAVRIDHIGSTAVPNLAAKDIIDIQITVADLADETIVRKLSAAGFVGREGLRRDEFIGFAVQETPQLQKRFFREREGERRTHMHIREDGRFNQRYPLLFRDFLRADELICQGYGLIKQRLSQIFPESVEGYLYIKDPLMDMIFHMAETWAESTNWSPDKGFL
jgi:GrpB-like predicted nucleotidyltransferase (UPF0157 family)